MVKMMTMKMVTQNSHSLLRSSYRKLSQMSQNISKCLLTLCQRPVFSAQPHSTGRGSRPPSVPILIGTSGNSQPSWIGYWGSALHNQTHSKAENSQREHCHSRNVTSHHTFSLLWLAQVIHHWDSLARPPVLCPTDWVPLPHAAQPPHSNPLFIPPPSLFAEKRGNAQSGFATARARPTSKLLSIRPPQTQPSVRWSRGLQSCF